jgi:hypothetical protein
MTYLIAMTSDTTTPIGAAENAGDITTADLSTFLFPNAFLFEGTTANCCIIGFHTYDLESGSAANGWREKRSVLNYASWTLPRSRRGAPRLWARPRARSIAGRASRGEPFESDRQVHEKRRGARRFAAV